MSSAGFRRGDPVQRDAEGIGCDFVYTHARDESHVLDREAEEVTMLDHVGFAVRDYDRSKEFYE